MGLSTVNRQEGTMRLLQKWVWTGKATLQWRKLTKLVDDLFTTMGSAVALRRIVKFGPARLRPNVAISSVCPQNNSSTINRASVYSFPRGLENSQVQTPTWHNFSWDNRNILLQISEVRTQKFWTPLGFCLRNWLDSTVWYLKFVQLPSNPKMHVLFWY